MVPQTYPSILNPYTNRREMVVKQLATTSGLQRWIDYIPVKLSTSTRPAGEQTTDNDGFIAINTSQDTSTGVAFKDWVPVYFDNDATDAWVVSASGYIPIGASGGALAILKSFGSNAHVYLPGPKVTGYGVELVTEASFSGSGWSMPGTTLTSDGTSSSATGPALTVGKTYTFTGNASGAVNLYLGSSTFTLGASGPFSFTGVCSGTPNVFVQNASGSARTVTSMSVREVITTSSVTAGLLSNNYTLSDGSTGYSAIDGTAGLVLDAAGSVGAELVANGGPFTVTTGYVANASTQSIDAGRIKWVTTGTGDNGGYIDIAVTANQPYWVAANVTNASAAQPVGLRGVDTGWSGITSAGTIAAGQTGTIPLYVVPTTSTLRVAIDRRATGTIGDTVYLNSLSVKPVTGIHATQSTTANKPALRRGLYNLLTYSNDLSNAAWTKSNVTISGNRVVEAAATSTHYVSESAVTVSGQKYTIVYEASAAERNYLGVYSGTPGQGVIFNLTTGAYFGNLVSAPDSYSIAPTGTGTYLCVINYTATAAASAPSAYVCDGTGAFNYLGDITKGINVFKAGHFAGTLTAAQILAEGGIPLTTSAAASNQSAGRYWWQFDGWNDELVCASAPFQIADDFAIVVAVNAYTVAGNPGVIAIDDGGLSNGVILYIPSGVPNVYVKAGGTSQQAQGPSISTGTPAVISVQKVGTTLTVRTNGVNGTSVSTASVGSTSFTSMRIGYQIVGAGYFTGAIGEPIVIKGTVSVSDLLTIERLVASNFPAGPVF